MKKIGRLILILLGVGLVLFLILQLIPIGKDHTNPPVLSEPDWDSPATRDLAQRACFDCHSNETVWPWYGNIAPVSWLLWNDVREGRDNMNFSEWNDGGSQDLQEIVEVIQEGEMPLPQYLLMHPEARLSDADKQALIDGLTQTLR
jgi:mono/diheme cytochrome c family protein